MEGVLGSWESDGCRWRGFWRSGEAVSADGEGAGEVERQ